MNRGRSVRARQLLDRRRAGYHEVLHQYGGIPIFTGQITNWQAVGGDNQAIVLINRVSGSGTRANMANYLFAGDDSKFAPSAMEGENAKVEQVVRETPGAISYLGFAYVGSAGLHVFAIDNVAPTRENVQSGAWPIGGQGYAITKGSSSAAAQAFLAFLSSPEFQNSAAFAQLGFVPLKK